MQALSESELLSILIGSGTTQHNAVEIGSMILSNFDRDLAKLSKADFREPKKVEGVVTYTACKIPAILNNATVVAFCHNHPSGNTRPSMVDDKLTQSFKKACEYMRIHFLDHVIVCDGQYYSYHENGRL